MEKNVSLKIPYQEIKNYIEKSFNSLFIQISVIWVCPWKLNAHLLSK